MSYPVIKGATYFLAHVPDLVQYGSKTRREISKDDKLLNELKSKLRNYDEAKSYPPNQVFIGNLKPEDLWNIETPWYQNLLEKASRSGAWGEVMPQDEFYALIKIADVFDLVFLSKQFVDKIMPKLEKHKLFNSSDRDKLGTGIDLDKIRHKLSLGALPLMDEDELVGCVENGHDEDENLKADIILENLACKATGVFAIRHALNNFNENPGEIDFIMNSGEEGVGDRYQRGAGNLAKAMGELSGCGNSTGADIKAFCCGPIHTMILAGSLIHSNVFDKVLVVGGGSLAKLGMKMKGHFSSSMQIMEDVLAAFAVIVGKDDGYNPHIRLDAIGKVDVNAGSSQQAIYESLVNKPLGKIGMKVTDIDKYSTELHNPEITMPAGSGNVPKNNYRMIGGLAVLNGQLRREELDEFEKKFGMPGFSPTQGHIPSAIPYLGFAREAILQGQIEKAMFVGKGSLFLAKMTNLSDGMSFIVQKNEREV